MMTAYRHILFAADFSPLGSALACRARELADLYAARLSVLHVVDDIPMPDTSYGTAFTVDKASEYDLLEAERLKLVGIGEELGVEIGDLWLVWGVPQDEIARLAETIGADLIVVGSHERHGLALLLGSTANGVLHHAPCDLLALRIPESQ